MKFLKKLDDPVQGEPGIDALHKEPFIFGKVTIAVGSSVTVSTKSGSTYSRWKYVGVTKRADGSILEMRIHRVRFGKVETADILIDALRTISLL